MKKMAVLLISWAVWAGQAGEPALDTNYFQMVLKRATAFELPAAAAQLVRQARPEYRIGTATNVVRVALRMRPAATLAVVEVVSRVDPDSAGAISETAVREQPGLAADIAGRAAMGAPGRAGEIVTRTGRAAPGELSDVANAAAGSAPGASVEILRAAAGVRPELGPFIEEEIARCGSSRPSVSGCLSRAEQNADRARKNGGGETSRGRGGRPGLKPPHEGGEPPGGRNYAKP
jgi:hypothetical protein